MTLHLMKLCVGADSMEDLALWQDQRLRARQDLAHVTRMMPKHAPEILAGGSLFWIIKGQMRVRQRITAIEPFVDRDGISRCALHFDALLVPVRPVPRRPFQGWRYLAAGDAPPDLPAGFAGDGMPEAMRVELSALGLL